MIQEGGRQLPPPQPHGAEPQRVISDRVRKSKGVIFSPVLFEGYFVLFTKYRFNDDDDKRRGYLLIRMEIISSF